MNFLRSHWYDLGGILAIIILSCIVVQYHNRANYQLLMWLHLTSLLLHQFEEYRIPGTFPGTINSILYGREKNLLDRYPLNTHSAFVVNVICGWTVFVVAALIGEEAIWFGMATIIVSLGNTIAHAVFFNIRKKTFYNAGLGTSFFLFLPCIYLFFKIIHTDNLVKDIDYFIGIPLGIAFNYFGILRIIELMKDKNTNYIFEQRNLLPKDRIIFH